MTYFDMLEKISTIILTAFRALFLLFLLTGNGLDAKMAIIKKVMTYLASPSMIRRYEPEATAICQNHPNTTQVAFNGVWKNTFNAPNSPSRLKVNHLKCTKMEQNCQIGFMSLFQEEIFFCVATSFAHSQNHRIFGMIMAKGVIV